MQGSYVVGVTGGSGSGKTSFVRILREQLGDIATFLSQDDYYVPTEEVAKDAKGIHNFDLPGSIDSARMQQDLRKLLQGHSVELREYTFSTIYCESNDGQSDTGLRGDLKILAPAPLIVVEGLFAMHEAGLKDQMDLRVYIDASDIAKLTRRIKRDRVERRLPLDDVLYRYENHVLPAYERYIAPYKKSCDIVINNEQGFEKGLEVLVSFLRSKAAGLSY